MGPPCFEHGGIIRAYDGKDERDEDVAAECDDGGFRLRGSLRHGSKVWVMGLRHLNNIVLVGIYQFTQEARNVGGDLLKRVRAVARI